LRLRNNSLALAEEIPMAALIAFEYPISTETTLKFGFEV
jgi:hypothetical protein